MKLRRCAFAWWWGMAVLVAALPAGAGVVDCDALTAANRRQAEVIGACVPDVPASVCIPATDTGLVALLDLWAEEANYQANVPCAAERREDDLGILVIAGDGDGTCTAALFGTEIPNPMPRAEVAQRYLAGQLNARIGARAANLAAEAERERVRGEQEPAVPVEGRP